MTDLEQRSGRELLRIQSVFPFDFFPDEIVVDENKVTFKISSFFLTKYVRSVRIKDLAAVTVNTSFFFASLQITDQYFAQEQLIIQYLKKGEAVQARRIIQGLMIADKEQLEFSNFSTPVVIDKLISLGRASEETTQ